MAAGTALEKWSTPSTSLQSQDFVKYQYLRRRSFTVLLEAADDVDLARTASGIPKVGWPHPTNFFLRVIRVNARRLSPILAEVDVDYESLQNPDNPAGNNPLNDPPKVTFDFNDVEIEVDRDADGKAMLTPNKEAYRGITSPSSDLVCRIVRNWPSFNVNLARSYKNCVNSDTFLGEPPGTAWLKGVGGESIGDDNFRYWQVYAEIHFRRAAPGSTDAKAWYKRVLRQGFRVKDANGKVDRAVDELGNFKVNPTILKADGTEETDAAATNIWDEFKIFESKPFAALGLV